MFMTPLVLKNLFTRPATRPYPREERPPFSGARGRLVNTASTCILCGMCARVCPSHCITVRRRDGMWEYDPFACVYCGLCAENCPTGSLLQREQRPGIAPHRQRIVLEIPAANKQGQEVGGAAAAAPE
ncbi:MAG: 4Fe-4S binding protein [Thermodesulfobacteriota bacterium]